MLRSVPSAVALAAALVLLAPATARAAGTVPEEDREAVTATAPVASPSRRTAFKYEVSWDGIPKTTRKFDAWIPLPVEDIDQEIDDLVVQSAGGGTMSSDAVHGNRIYHGSSGPRGGVPFNVVVRFIVERREVKSGDLSRMPAIPPDAPANLSDYLESSPLLRIDGKLRAAANKAVGRQKEVPAQAHAIYDWILANVSLSEEGPGRADGEIEQVMARKSGNSLDIATAFVGLARAAGIPARTVLGFKLPEEQQKGFLQGYHAWAEFWLPGRGWIPVDPASAMKMTSRKDYYFGNLDEHRIRYSHGRGVNLVPPQSAEPLSFLFYPYAEADGTAFGGSGYRFSFLPAPEPPADGKAGL
jgi:transglutaminase-like putative cysteine protease